MPGKEAIVSSNEESPQTQVYWPDTRQTVPGPATYLEGQARVLVWIFPQSL